MANELVPKGLPHGERQRMVEARRQAGLPNDAPQGSSSLGPGSVREAQAAFTQPRPARPDYDPLVEATPDMFGVPNPPVSSAPAEPASLRVLFAERAASSGNPLARAVAARLSEMFTDAGP